MSDTPDRYAELREAAEKAAAVPWELGEYWRDAGFTKRDGRYLAAADPQTVLALLSEVKSLRARNRELEGGREIEQTMLRNAATEIQSLRARLEAAGKVVEAVKDWRSRVNEYDLMTNAQAHALAFVVDPLIADGVPGSG